MADKYAADKFAAAYGVDMNEEGFKIIRKYVKQYGEDEVYRAIDIACEKYEDPVTAFMKLSGILYVRRSVWRTVFKQEEPHEVHD